MSRITRGQPPGCCPTTSLRRRQALSARIGAVQLSSGAQAPIAGTFSPDGTIFFTSTTGDNLVHMVNTTTLKDTQTIDPALTTMETASPYPPSSSP